VTGTSLRIREYDPMSMVLLGQRRGSARTRRQPGGRARGRARSQRQPPD
jgi:hypothetical protein